MDMAYIPAKIIESELKKIGISIDGYDVIQCIEYELFNEKNIDYATEFEVEYTLDNSKLTFIGAIVEDERTYGNGQTLPCLRTDIDSCRIISDKSEHFVDINVYLQ